MTIHAHAVAYSNAQWNVRGRKYMPLHLKGKRTNNAFGYEGEYVLNNPTEQMHTRPSFKKYTFIVQ